jgi:hypothetical protein
MRVEMPEFDVVAFVAKLERLGVKLTAIPLADGKLRINRWRMLHAAEHTQQIQDLWVAEVGDDQARIDLLASHLNSRPGVAPRVTANRVLPSRPPADRSSPGVQKAK